MQANIHVQPIVQRLKPPTGAVGPPGQCQTAESGVRSQYLEISTCASSPGVTNPPTIVHSGANAWATLPQAQQAHLGRRTRMTRCCVGTQSSISLSPMALSEPPENVQVWPSSSSRQAPERFGVSASMAIRWLDWLKKQGDVATKWQDADRKLGCNEVVTGRRRRL